MHDLTDREIDALDRLEAHATAPHPYLSRLAATKQRELLERGATFVVEFAGAAIDAGRVDLARDVLTRLFEDVEGEALEPGEVRP